MFYWLYERMLLSQIQDLPRHICFMISSADLAAEPGKCLEVTGWCTGLNTILAHRPTQAAAQTPSAIQGLTFHITQLSPDELAHALPEIKKISSVARLVLHHGTTREISGTGSRGRSRHREKRAGGDHGLHPPAGRERYPAIGDR